MANRLFNQFSYGFERMPVTVNCTFKVLASNANGYSSLVGPGVANVSIHTSTTASATNLNPAAGYIVVTLQDKYTSLLGFRASWASPLSGSSLLVASAGLTVGQVYT